MTICLSAMLVAALHGPSLRRLECGSVRRIVAEVARILYLDSFTTRRGVPIDLCTAVVVTSFIKRRRVDVELLVVEFHGCLPDVGLPAILDKPDVPVRISADVHELVSVVTC